MECEDSSKTIQERPWIAYNIWNETQWFPSFKKLVKKIQKRIDKKLLCPSLITKNKREEAKQ
jgi:hypothetical protein